MAVNYEIIFKGSCFVGCKDFSPAPAPHPSFGADFFFKTCSVGSILSFNLGIILFVLSKIQNLCVNRHLPCHRPFIGLSDKAASAYKAPPHNCLCKDLHPAFSEIRALQPCFILRGKHLYSAPYDRKSREKNRVRNQNQVGFQ